MLRNSQAIRDVLHGRFSIQRFSFVLLVAGVLGLSVVAVIFGVTTAIRAMYGVFGVLLVLLMTYTRDGHAYRVFVLRPDQMVKLVVSLSALGLTTVYVTQTRILIFGFVFVGYLVVAASLVDPESDSRWLAPLAVLLFSTLLFSKYLTTGFYFGGGDMLGHVRSIEELLQSGIGAISYTSYSSWPGLHVVSGFTSLVTGLPAYDSLMLFGMLLVSASTVAVYYLYRVQFSHRTTAVAAVLLFTTFPLILYFGNYIFPQTIAFALGIYIIYLAYSATASQTNARARLALGALFVCAMTVTHHFTALVLLPAIVFIIGWDVLNVGVRDAYRRLPVHSALLSFWILALLYYWIFVNDWLFSAVLYAFGQAVPAGLSGIVGLSSGGDQSSPTEGSGTGAGGSSSGGTGAESSSSNGSAASATGNADGGSAVSGGQPSDVSVLGSDYGFGVDLWGDTVPRSLTALFGPDLLHQATLACFALLGVIAVLRYRDRIRSKALLYLSILSVPLVFRTPLQIHSLRRVKMVWVLFFVGLIAFGIGRGIQRTDIGVNRSLLAGVLVLSAISGAGAVTAADDIEIFHPSDQRMREVDIDNEYPMFRELSSFSQRHDANVSGAWISKAALNRFGQSTQTASASRSGLSAQTKLLLVREEWTEKRMKIDKSDSIYKPNVYFSKQSLDSMTRFENQVYSTGDLRLLHSNDSAFRPVN